MSEEEVISHTMMGAQGHDFEDDVREGEASYAHAVRGVNKRVKIEMKTNNVCEKGTHSLHGIETRARNFKKGIYIYFITFFF